MNSLHDISRRYQKLPCLRSPGWFHLNLGDESIYGRRISQLAIGNNVMLNVVTDVRNFPLESFGRYFEAVSAFVINNKTACIYGVGVIVLTTCSYTLLRDIRKRIFVWVSSKSDKIRDEKKYEQFRLKLVAPLKSIVSHDPALRKEKNIRILEIGVGCGDNLKHYPDGAHLVLVDPNPHFKQHFTKKLTGNLKINPEDIIVSKGEDMDVVPSESVDAVVVSLVLCSVTDVSKVLRQVKRVLVPGGKFLFMEHVHEWDTKTYRARRIIQSLLTVTRIWPFLFEGCILNRDPLPLIRAAGFSQVKAEYLYAPILCTVFKVGSPHVIGEATK
ncbi:thiol S-methyltransferase TMT1A-like [Macrobrachium rosenbergii]|uniref:thiol S-methyltransferase TMT1A-like n=1 Tax=Macrobrachium rosenbergii TaxID=79674 RepID=UPI0034D749BB